MEKPQGQRILFFFFYLKVELTFCSDHGSWRGGTDIYRCQIGRDKGCVNYNIYLHTCHFPFVGCCFLFSLDINKLHLYTR